jgi:hypothetical protein
MALTAWEAMKVIGEELHNLGAAAEKFEDETGEPYKITREQAIQIGLSIITKVGVEIMD